MSTDPMADLLALERSHDDLPDGADARILARVESVVASGGGGGDDDGGDEGSGGSGPAPRGEASSLAAPIARAAPWLGRAAYLAVGVVAGASAHAVLATAPAAPAVVVSASSAPPSIAVPVASASIGPVGVRVEDLPSEPTRPVTSSARGAVAAPASARRDDTRIVEERAELDVARAALSRGRIDACLEGIERHTRTYGEGHFAEEREVLAVQALAAAGRTSEAAARARRFREKYPTSLFGPAVSDSLAPGSAK